MARISAAPDCTIPRGFPFVLRLLLPGFTSGPTNVSCLRHYPAFCRTCTPWICNPERIQHTQSCMVLARRCDERATVLQLLLQLPLAKQNQVLSCWRRFIIGVFFIISTWEGFVIPEGSAELHFSINLTKTIPEQGEFFVIFLNLLFFFLR